MKKVVPEVNLSPSGAGALITVCSLVGGLGLRWTSASAHNLPPFTLPPHAPPLFWPQHKASLICSWELPLTPVWLWSSGGERGLGGQTGWSQKNHLPASSGQPALCYHATAKSTLWHNIYISALFSKRASRRGREEEVLLWEWKGGLGLTVSDRAEASTPSGTVLTSQLSSWWFWSVLMLISSQHLQSWFLSQLLNARRLVASQVVELVSVCCCHPASLVWITPQTFLLHAPSLDRSQLLQWNQF